MTINRTANLMGLTDPHLQQAAAMLSRAFYDDPWVLYLYPDEVERRRRLPGAFGITLRYALHYGEIATTADVMGTVCWLPPGKTTPTLKGMLKTGSLRPSFQLGWQGMLRSSRLQIYQNKLHKRYVSEPHWYLSLLGVDPPFQGRGIGSMLLRSGLERAEAARLPAYLETMNPRNVPFYQKFGFSIVHEGEIPGSNVRMWSMLRTPR